MAAQQGLAAVFASWEAPPDITRPMVGAPEVAIPYILGWDLGELERWLGAEGIALGSVVAIDYVQLISDFGQLGSVERLIQLAEHSGFRVLAGFMPGRDLDALEERPAPALAARMVGESVGTKLAGADRAAIICGTGTDSRSVIMSTRPASGRVTWHAEWRKPTPATDGLP